MAALESQLKRAVEGRLKKLAATDPGLTFRKRWGSIYTTSGDPDITGLWNGHHFELELKVPGASPTPLQWHRLREWERAGALCFVIHSLQEFDVAIFTVARAALAKRDNSTQRGEGTGGEMEKWKG